eukprot:gene26763-32883_t
MEREASYLTEHELNEETPSILAQKDMTQIITWVAIGSMGLLVPLSCLGILIRTASHGPARNQDERMQRAQKAADEYVYLQRLLDPSPSTALPLAIVINQSIQSSECRSSILPNAGSALGLCVDAV